MERQHLLIRILRRGEEFGLLCSFLLLILVEAGYVAWLERLPAIPARDYSDPFLLMPPWYQHPEAEVMLLLALVGGMIGWAGVGLVQFLQISRRCNSAEESLSSTAPAEFRDVGAQPEAVVSGPGTRP